MAVAHIPMMKPAGGNMEIMLPSTRNGGRRNYVVCSIMYNARLADMVECPRSFDLRKQKSPHVSSQVLVSGGTLYV